MTQRNVWRTQVNSDPGPGRVGRPGREGGQHEPGEQATPSREESVPVPPPGPGEEPAATPADTGTAQDLPEGYEPL